MKLKKAWVIMLPTKDKTNINLFKNNISINPVILSNKFGETEVSKPQHLYVISDEEIKEGDWFLCGSEVHKCTGNYSLKVSSYVKCKKGDCSVEICKKIIATTDTSISKPEKGYNWDRVVYPQPSQGFIEKYIKEYDKGSIITGILVEYEEHNIRCSIHNLSKEECTYGCTLFKPGDKKLKISKDNTITIHPVKDSWTREELLTLCDSAYNAGKTCGLSKYNDKLDYQSFDDWVKQHITWQEL